MVTVDEIVKAHKKYIDLMFSHWLHNELFQWQWWLLLGLSVIPWVIWWKVVDKKRIQELLIFGLLVALISSLLDIYGWSRNAWIYPIKFLPMPIPLFPIDDVAIPVIHMIIYQYFRSWKSFLIAEIVVAFLFAFIGEPLLVWIGIYQPLDWKYIYSILPYVGKSLLSRWITEKITRATVK